MERNFTVSVFSGKSKNGKLRGKLASKTVTSNKGIQDVPFYSELNIIAVSNRLNSYDFGLGCTDYVFAVQRKDTASVWELCLITEV
jgi:hypothetical protein